MVTAATPPIPAARPDSTKRVRLAFLDGIRGLTALYVVFHHAVMELDAQPKHGSLPMDVRLATHWLLYGPLAVSVFIVLSGYCLMLPVVRSGGTALPGGVRSYFLRRAQRILPPYYAAMALTLLVVALVPGLQKPDFVHWDAALPIFTPGVIVSHLLLVHNLRPGWITTIDPPMWSIAVEWQIYFLFPLILLPVWRRFGVAAAVLVGFAIGLAPPLLFNGLLDWSRPWYVGLFALGMAGAVIGFGSERRELLRAVPWSWAAALGLVGVVFARLFNSSWLQDAGVGIAAFSLINHCAAELVLRHRDRPSIILRALESRPLVSVGRYSYSLYLIHFPLLSLLHLELRHLHEPPIMRLCVLLTLGVGASLVLGYAFYCAVERPLMPRRRA